MLVGREWLKQLTVSALNQNQQAKQNIAIFLYPAVEEG
jgi:hypothetical protein